MVLDTNVLLDGLALYSVPAPGDEQFICEKQGWAWLLFMKLHAKRLTSISLNEVREMVMRLVDREDESERRVAQTFLWLAKDELLPHWSWQCVENFTHATGSPADDDYLRLASKLRLPLITNEDWTSTGIRQPPKKGSLRQRATNSRVAVFTAREFVERSRFPARTAAQTFFREWDTRSESRVLMNDAQPIPAADVRHVRGLIEMAVSKALGSAES